jgi:4-hydroxy-4-methyl-2-oxoglutarate aldolase
MIKDRLDPAESIRSNIVRVAPGLIDAARALPSATLHEAAGKRGALPAAIKPTATGSRLIGPAITVHSPGGDNLWLHRAIYVAQPGDVLVIHTHGQYEYGYWGEIMSTAAKAKGLGGMVIDACVRDGDLLKEIGFPVFARGLCIRGTGKDFGARGFINAPVLFDDVVVHPGDLILGDGDGVVCISQHRVAEVLKAAQQREQQEAEILKRLQTGATTLDIYGWN